MSLATWKRITELKEAIEKDFANTGCPKEGCPPGPRVHLFYAHYAARPNVEKNVEDLWKFVTLDAYKACTEPRHAKAALDFLACHFLWVLDKGVKLEKLPQPPTVLPINDTADDGGTVIRFENTNFPASKDKDKLHRVKVTTPAYIQDWTLVEKYGETVSEEAKKEEDAEDGAKIAEDKALAGDTTTDGTTTDETESEEEETELESGATYTKLRRLCTSLVGQAGDHLLIEAKEDADINAKLVYHTPQQDSELRLFCNAPGFNFELRGKKKTTEEKTETETEEKKDGETEGEEQMSNVVLGGQDDPWIKSTRDLGKGKALWETSSETWVGDLVSSPYGNGIQKLASASGCTTTEDLATTYATELGKSRGIVFKAVKDIEGACESIQTWDGDKISWGINQWTVGTDDKGELYQILSFIYDFFPDAFARRFGYFGIGMWFKSRQATFAARTAYDEPIGFRVPCCGPAIRGAITAILVDSQKQEEAKGKKGTKKTEGTKADGGGTPSDKKTDDTKKEDEPKDKKDDLPPVPAKALANALRLRRHDTTSQAMCFVFTTAGADKVIQKAQAQWMSYRITSTSPVGKTMKVVITEFLKDLGASADKDVRNAKAIIGLGPEYYKQAYSDALKTVPKEPKNTYDKRLIVEVGNLIEPQITDRTEEIFSDDDADELWIDWNKRCEAAGKATVGTVKGDTDKGRTQRAAVPTKTTGTQK